MKSRHIILASLLLMAACSRAPKEASHNELIGKIDSMENVAKGIDIAAGADTSMASMLIDDYLTFAERFPTDSLTPGYLHHAAQWAESLGRIDDMVAIYDRVIDNYPNYAKLDECYYEKGIALDNAGRKEEARKAYNDFLDAYPDHFLANDIRSSLPLLDMSDELLIQYLEQKSKK